MGSLDARRRGCRAIGCEVMDGDWDEEDIFTEGEGVVEPGYLRRTRAGPLM